MTPLLDQLLLPQRLITRGLDDLHRIAEAAVSLGVLARDLRSLPHSLEEWMSETASSLTSLRDQAIGVRTAIEPMSTDVTILRDEFGRANDEIARLREAFGPELEALRGSADGLHQELRQVRQLLGTLQTNADQLGQQVIEELAAVRGDVRALAREADEISEVVEPLQGATERVGRVANRLPVGGKS